MNTNERKLCQGLNPIAAAISLALLSGCSVFHPLREPADLPILPTVLDSAVQANCQYAGCMERAIDYAEHWRRHYYNEAANTQLWRNAMLAPLLPISAISLYRSTQFENEKKLIGGYAAAGGAMFGLTRYFGLPKQQSTYLTASHTLSCTILNARNILVPSTEFATLQSQIEIFTKVLPGMQLAYGNLLAAAAQEQDEEIAKEIKAKILNPLAKRVAFFERLHARAIALRNDNRTSGEALRRKVDLITAETAAQLTADIPEPEKILALIGDFQGTADKIGIGAFPATATAPVTPAVPPVAVPTNLQVMAASKEKATEILKNYIAAFELPKTVDKFKDEVGLQHQKNLQTGANIDNELENISAKAAKKVKDATTRARVQKELTEAVKQAIDGSDTAPIAVNVKPKAVEPKTKATTSTIPGTVFDQLLLALKVAKTIELHATSEKDLDFKGTFTRPATMEEQTNALKVAKAKNKHAMAIQRKVEKFAHDKAEAAYEEMKNIRIPAENVYHHLRGILATKATVLKDCKPDAEKEPPPFTISPEVTDISLVKDKPTEFTISNDKKIPKVTISGKNTDKIKQEVKLKGEDFVVVVTATAVIPDGEEAILTVTDFTGKRKFEIKMDASAPK